MLNKLKLKRHNLLIIGSVLFIVVTVLMARIPDLKYYLEIAKEVIIIEGENPSDSNYYDSPGFTIINRELLGNMALELQTSESVENGYYAAYDFEIKKSGDYNIVFCGTPPGPLEVGSEWHSPYSVSIDNKITKKFYEEEIAKEWPKYSDYNYIEGGYFFIKLMTVKLDKGMHKIEIRVNDRRKRDNVFTLFTDAFVISPVGFKPGVKIKKIPPELFADL